ncbi:MULTISPECIES: hypothetical protein [Marichromatium]|uniref:Uncharacterized protein n=1 Tax=Marichromatium gracile TaxID=1048 RepID=A0A4R4A5D6_MARGR|nr:MULTISPECIES: hypothetical protein [Marichromatium]MBK1709813.1 hypothetical protein [Marichromatium gracile]RNE89866.1 hypothetical protein EBL84_09260 [Marichromatium sp. AB31]TCW32677.1 hypothetical protein EDC29_11743 [Marichromatium gracile]
MPRLTADQWESVRADREAGASFGELAARHGVSKAAIVKRAKKESWGDGTDVGEVVRRKVTEKVTGVVTVGDPQKKAAALDAAADRAAAVVRRQQDDWDAHRERFGSVPVDFDAGKLAKISAEMLAIRQKGERAAWGLEESEKPKDRASPVVFYLPDNDR